MMIGVWHRKANAMVLGEEKQRHSGEETQRHIGEETQRHSGEETQRHIGVCKC
jgi:hypothetical protein